MRYYLKGNSLARVKKLSLRIDSHKESWHVMAISVEEGPVHGWIPGGCSALNEFPGTAYRIHLTCDRGRQPESITLIRIVGGTGLGISCYLVQRRLANSSGQKRQITQSVTDNGLTQPGELNAGDRPNR